MYEQEKWELRAAAAARRGLSAESVDLVMFPAYSGRTVASREGRKGLLRDHLRKQLGGVSELLPLDETPPPIVASAAGPPPFPLEGVCARCRGHCCRNGGEHGYVTSRTLQRVLAADPTANGDALIDTYVSHVPTRSYLGSCIYHGPSGCALPRALRSETCTRYMCSSLKRASEGAGANSERAIIGVFEPASGSARLMMVHDPVSNQPPPNPEP